MGISELLFPGRGCKAESSQGTYPGEGHAGGVHRRGGWHKGAVATEHHQAGQPVQERGRSGSWLLEEQEPGEGPLKKGTHAGGEL